MSVHLFEHDVLFLQRFATIAGVYNGPMDGHWTEQVDKAEKSLFDTFEEIRSHLGEFDPRSEKNIATLLPNAQKKCRELMNAAAKMPYQYKILSGTRTYSEQNELYTHGRSAPGTKVTNAVGGRSNHNFGIAWDVGIFDNGMYLRGRDAREDKIYESFGKDILKAVSNIEWGGNWRSFKDKPHFQLATNGKSVAAIEQLFEEGKAFA